MESFARDHGFPLVVKPSDSSGQRGTTLVQNASALPPALASALTFATDGQAIVETFCAGPEINVTAAVSGGRVQFLSMSDRVTAAPPHFGIAIEHIFPPCVNKNMVGAIRHACVKAIEAVELTDGIVYPQVIASPTGPRVIEIAVRIPGGHMREVALFRSGIDLIEVAILQALGNPNPLSACRHSTPVLALSVKFITELDYPEHGGRPVSAIQGFEETHHCPNVHHSRLYLSPGQPLPALNSSAARFGVIIAAGEDRAEACRCSAEAALKLRVQFASA